KSIDIYALGALLFEMVTGQVPFFGASAAEVLMKHLGTKVDLKDVPEPFASVIARAMAKDPADRYQNVQEMVEAVFGADHVRNSVSHFSPNDLSIMAGYAARRINPANGSFVPSSAPGSALSMENFRRLGARLLGPIRLHRTRMPIRARFARYFTPPPPHPSPPARAPIAPAASLDRGPRLVPRAIIVIWLCAFSLAGMISLMFLASLIFARNSGRDFGIFLGMGLAIGTLARAFYFQAMERIYTGIWPYALRPMIVAGCKASAIAAAASLIFGPHNDDDVMVALFFFIAPLVVLHCVKTLFPRFLSQQGDPMVAPAQIVRPPAPTAPPQPIARPLVEGKLVSRTFGALLRFASSMIGSALLFVAIMLALAVAVDVPGLLNSQLPDPAARTEMRRTFGRADWPRLMRDIGAAASFAAGIIATALMILGRKRSGFAHRFRVFIGVVILFTSVSILGHGLGDWGDLVRTNNGWEMFDQFATHADKRMMVLACGAAGIALLVLFWPAGARTAAGKTLHTSEPNVAAQS
ncbi:MAG TPA: hypothetical protein VGH65_07480, partial [Verrucomicrobiaceae bacterium]